MKPSAATIRPRDAATGGEPVVESGVRVSGVDGVFDLL
jgi:hypothetical protein